MKMTPAEKANDSIIRAFNKQIENAYRKLGYNHTVTQNLVNQAKSIYGAQNLKEMKITAGYTAGQIDKATGEIFGIPQINRNRANVSNGFKAKALKAATQYTAGDKKGQYKSMYDVTKAHQKAIEQVRQDIIKKSSNKEIKKLMRYSRRLENLTEIPIKYRNKQEKAIHNYIKQFYKELTKGRISQKLIENDLASEIFAAYEQAKEEDDDLELYQDFARNYHDGKELDYDLLSKIQTNRYETMLEKSLENPELTTGLTGDKLNEFLNSDGWTEILNPFE